MSEFCPASNRRLSAPTNSTQSKWNPILIPEFLRDSPLKIGKNLFSHFLALKVVLLVAVSRVIAGKFLIPARINEDS